MEMHLSPEQLQNSARRILQDTGCGSVFRVKGFTQNGNAWVEVNATRKQIETRPLEKGQEIFIVIGEHLKEDKIKSLIG